MFQECSSARSDSRGFKRALPRDGLPESCVSSRYLPFFSISSSEKQSSSGLSRLAEDGRKMERHGEKGKEMGGEETKRENNKNAEWTRARVHRHRKAISAGRQPFVRAALGTSRVTRDPGMLNPRYLIPSRLVLSRLVLFRPVWEMFVRCTKAAVVYLAQRPEWTRVSTVFPGFGGSKCRVDRMKSITRRLEWSAWDPAFERTTPRRSLRRLPARAWLHFPCGLNPPTNNPDVLILF